MDRPIQESANQRAAQLYRRRQKSRSRATRPSPRILTQRTALRCMQTVSEDQTEGGSRGPDSLLVVRTLVRGAETARVNEMVALISRVRVEVLIQALRVRSLRLGSVLDARTRAPMHLRTSRRRRPTPQHGVTHHPVVVQMSFGSLGKAGHQLYNQFGDGKLDSVNLQGMPADEAQRACDGSWRLTPARAAHEQTQANG